MPTIGEITKSVASASTKFEITNNELKRRYMQYNISSFNIMASHIGTSLGTFGTGYPFYALDENLKGKLPIIEEQKRYNEELTIIPTKKRELTWKCNECLRVNYEKMPDLKFRCKRCKEVPDNVKPRKIINRIPDIDMWIICKDATIEQTEEKAESLAHEVGMDSSDRDPNNTFETFFNIVNDLSLGILTQKFLPLDMHIIEYSKLLELIGKVPEIIDSANENEKVPFLPISPKSYRKTWQYDDEPYNFIADFLVSFHEFNVPQELKNTLNEVRRKLIMKYSDKELYDIAMKSSAESTRRRFENIKLKENFMHKIQYWRKTLLQEVDVASQKKKESDEFDLEI